MVRSVTLKAVLQVGIVLLAGAVTGQSQTPIAPAAGVINAASFLSPIAPGGLISIFGRNLASTATAPGAPLPTDMIVEHMAMFYDTVRERGPRTMTGAYATAVTRRFFDFRSPLAAYVQIPRSYVILQRINLGLFALLGELSIAVTPRSGGSNPCEPQEPYQQLSVSVVTLDRTYDEKTETDGTKPRRLELDIGGFWVITRTGEIERMRVCAE